MAQGKTAIFAIRGRRLIDGRNDSTAPDPVVLVEGRRIKSVGTLRDTVIPDGAQIIDTGECTLMPGMIDLHVHVAAFNCLTFQNYRVATFEISPQLQMFYCLYHAQLCFEMGFTTLRDMGRGTPYGGYTTEFCALRDAINAGIVPGPRMIVSGRTMITGSHFDLLTLPRAAKREPDFTADGPWALRRLAREHLRTGCDVIKTCVSGGVAAKSDHNVRNMTQEELDAVVDEAHAFNKPVAVHCFTPDGQRMCVNAGVDTIEHMVFTDDDAIARIKDSGRYVVPTLLHRSDIAIERRREHGASEGLVAKMKEIQPACFDTFRRMHTAGVRIAMGTDTTIDPEMGENARELQMYVELGMSPMDAIKSATRNAAEAIGMLEELGSLEPGKLADMIAVDGDPSRDVRALQDRERIKLVVKEGEIYVDKLSQDRKYVIHPQPVERKIIDRL
jgi:imidazolonepropionase-like amidohydrolase